MRISELIEKLKRAQAQYGDLPLSNDEGYILGIEFTAVEDGLGYARGRAITPNQIFIDFRMGSKT